MSSDGELQNIEPTTPCPGRPGLATRLTNALKHPGKVVSDQIQHRRSHSQVVADTAAAEQVKVAEAAKKLQLINDIAIIKLRLEQEMIKVRESKLLNSTLKL